MILPGHLALAILGHKFFRADLSTVVAGTLAPDIVDKSLAHALHITPGGRYGMHSFLGWLISSSLVGLLCGRKRGFAWAVGHFAHFAGDEFDMPWWLPFKRYHFGPVEDLDEFLAGAVGTSGGRRRLALETLLLALVILAFQQHDERTSTDDPKLPRYLSGG